MLMDLTHRGNSEKHFIHADWGNIYVSNEIYMPCIEVLINENELQFVV